MNPALRGELGLVAADVAIGGGLRLDRAQQLAHSDVKAGVLPFPDVRIFSYADCVHTQVAYNTQVKAVFVELPAFERLRADYLDDAPLAGLQQALMTRPEAREVIPGAGGLHKKRYAYAPRGKGKRGGLRVIYFWSSAGMQFWLYTLYDKDELVDLTPKQCKALKAMLKAELESRRST